MNTRGLSRRQFLGAAGAVLGLTALGAGQSFALAPSTTSFGRIGLYLPNAKYYPNLATEFTNGFRQAFDGKIKIASQGTSLEDFAAANDTIISYASANSVRFLKDALAKNNSRLIAADLGMDILRQADLSSNIHFLSLNFWQASQALARWLAANIGTNIAIVADTYETGYDSFSVFERHFSSDKLFVFDTTNIENLLSNLRATDADVVAFALHSERAEAFVRAYEGSGMRIPLARLPFVGKAVTPHSVPLYTARIALDSAPFYALGQALALNLQGLESNTQAEIVIEQSGVFGSSEITRIASDSLTTGHGLNNAFKTGWTSPYLV